MAVFLLVSKILVFLGIVLYVEACKKDSECGNGQYCCMSRCTSRKLQCSELCSKDQDCKRDQLCTHQRICEDCSKRSTCELKSCYNDTDCPSGYCCAENHTCLSSKVPKRHTFSLLPFIIIIAVLGFALIILCYTEGCWKELFIYFKRHWGRYGSVALDEVEAERREGENESVRHSNTNKSCVNNVQSENVQSNMSSNSSQLGSTSTNSPQTLRNTRVISRHSQTLVMAISQATRNQARASTNTHSDSIVTSSSDTSGLRDSGSEPLLTSILEDSGSNSIDSPPTYLSLFNEECEEQPPKYEDVVNIAPVPVDIEMRTVVAAYGSNRSLRSQDNNELETMV